MYLPGGAGRRWLVAYNHAAHGKMASRINRGDRLDREENEPMWRYIPEGFCMAESDFHCDDDGRYYTDLAAAFVRGKIGGSGELSSEELIGLGKDRGLRLHKFKRQAELPRVRKVLGVLQGLAPASLLDMGSGRGAFLWPLLDAFPHLEVIALDHNPTRVAD